MRLSTRSKLVTGLLLVALAAVLAPGLARAAHRGIPLMLGDTVTTSVTPAGDVDTFVFDGMAGGQLNLTLSPTKGSGLMPRLELLEPSGAPVDLTGFLKAKGAMISLKKLVLPVTGIYALQVIGEAGTVGEYQLKTKGKPPKGEKATVNLAPGEEIEFLFPAATDSQIVATLKAKGGTFEVLSVFDPDGGEIPGGAKSFATKKTTTKGTLYLVGRLGDYGFRIGNADASLSIKAKVKAKHPKVKGAKRPVSALEPVITSLDPVFGRLNTPVTVTGQNFQTGNVQVLFGETPAKSVSWKEATTIDALSPGGDGVVDVTVINPDGQEHTLPGSYTFIAQPPDVTTVTPNEGPDSGGTVVDVLGARMTFVVKVTFGVTALVAPHQILADNHLRFTTEPHAPGRFSLILTDEFGQTETVSGAFEFFEAPRITSLDPPGGSKRGGARVTIHGQNFRPDDTVRLDGSMVSPVTYGGPTALEFTTPAHAVGFVDVTVEDPWDRSDTLESAFEYRELGLVDDTEAKMPANDSDVLVGGTRIVMGDIDGDGDVDIVLGRETEESTNTIVLVNDGKGGFSAGEKLPSPQVQNDLWEAGALALGDVDGDKDLDLVVTSEKKFGNPQAYKYQVGKYTYRVYYRPYSSTRVLLNDGKGSFTQKKDAVPEPRRTTTDLLQGNAASLGDVDGDGDLDLVVARAIAAEKSTRKLSPLGGYAYDVTFSVSKDTTSPATRVLLNDGNGKFTDATASTLPKVSDGDLLAGDDLLLGDLDGDEQVDVIVLTGDGKELRDAKAAEYVKGSKTRVFMGDGKGKFTNDTATLFPAPKDGDDWGGVALAQGDLDGDDDSDLVVATGRALVTSGGSYLPSTRVFTQDEYGITETTADTLPSVRSDGQGDLLRATGIAVGKLGEGVPDILLTRPAAVMVEDPDSGSFDKQASSTRLLKNDGKGVFTNVTADVFPDPEKSKDYYLAHALALGDVDGDEDLDVVLTTMHESYTGTGKRPTRLFRLE